MRIVTMAMAAGALALSGLSATGTAQAQSTLQAEPQVATGQFTTALEVRPIMNATKSSWVAVREYEGKDLLYVSHIMAWRCGLVRLRVGVNGGQLQEWTLPPCHLGTNAPNAVTPDDGPIYVEAPLGLIQEVAVEITYDDLETDFAVYQRPQVLMP